MPKSQNFIAVDLGATSGRIVLGMFNEDSLQLHEVSRFPNSIIAANGHYYWNFLGLYHSILEGIKAAAARNIEITSIGIDTWGVDFACFDRNGELLGNPYSYRDPHTRSAQEEFFRIVPRDEVYRSTGIQFMDFNSLFQLHAMRSRRSPLLEAADKILFMPDAFSFLLTGQMVSEYTITSTSQMMDARRRRFDPRPLAALGLTDDHFGRPVYPGEHIGVLTEMVQQQTGLGPVPVIAVAGHDTASAVAAVPARDKHFAYLSSGTWSLMGIESDTPIINDESFALNFTNEGSASGGICFLKNICGLWLLERCRQEWEGEGEATDYSRLIAEAAVTAPFACCIDPDDAAFANPSSMVAAIQEYARRSAQNPPHSRGHITRTIFESLAFRYRAVLASLRRFADFPIERLHVIGGGSRNSLLNQFTANALGIPVTAGPTEATAIGNILIQARAAGVADDSVVMPTGGGAGLNVTHFSPQEQSLWADHYEHFMEIAAKGAGMDHG